MVGIWYVSGLYVSDGARRQSEYFMTNVLGMGPTHKQICDGEQTRKWAIIVLIV